MSERGERERRERERRINNVAFWLKQTRRLSVMLVQTLSAMICLLQICDLASVIVTSLITNVSLMQTVFQLLYKKNE